MTTSRATDLKKEREGYAFALETTGTSDRRNQVARLMWSVLLYWLSSSPLTAQVATPKFRSLSQEQGLSNNSVTSIYQDRAGFIWIGTRNGLNRYDGYTLQAYTKDGAGNLGIPRDNIYDVCEDAHGQLLLVTLNGELLRKDSLTHQFRPFFSAAEKRRFGFDAMSLLKVYTDRQGILWLTTQQHGLVAFDPRTRTGRFYTTRSRPAIAGNKVMTVLEDSQRRIWVGTDAGLTLISPDRRSSRQYRPATEPTGREATHVNTLFEDRLGRLWVGTEHGVFLRQPGSRELTPLATLTEATALSGIIRVLQDDGAGNIWIGTDAGLFIFDLQKQTLIPVKTDASQRYALRDQYIFSICRDRQGNMWVGTYYGGVSVNYVSTTGFEQFAQPRAHEKLDGRIIRDIVEDKAGNVWFGLENKGVVGLMSDQKTVRTLNGGGNPAQSLLGDQIQGMDDDTDGTLWIGSYNKGLNHYTPQTGQVTPFRHDSKNPGSLSSNAVNNVLVDRRGRLWVGTNLGGINRYDKARKTFRQYHHARQPNSLDNDQIATLCEDRQGRIWVGTTTGLNRYDEPRDAFVRYPRLNRSASSAGLYVTAIYEDRRGTLWIGTAGDGLFALNGRTGDLRRPQPDRQLTNATVYKILEDQNGQLWFSSNTGLYRFDTPSNRYEKYTISDGLATSQFNYNSGSSLSSGQLIFGSVNGYALFDPVHIRKSTYTPTVVITDFLINNQPARLADVGTNPLRAVRLAHDQSTLSFAFVALEYGSHDNKRYAYKLEGYDDDWSVPAVGRSATYTRLPPGQYRFVVKATNNGGNRVSASAPVLVTIRPPWWQTTGACVIYALAFFGVIYLLGRYSIIEINRKEQLLRDHYERERDLELNAMKYRFFTNVSHEFRTPLTLINAPLEDILAHQVTLNSQQVTQRLTLMKQQVGKMIRLVDQLMDVSKAEAGYLTLHPQNTDIVDLCRQAIRQFEPVAMQQHIDLQFRSAIDGQFAWLDADKIEKALYNLLTNAFKFTPANGRITVQLDRTNPPQADQRLVITVSDTGIGIPQTDLPRVFERFYQVDNQKKIAQNGTGIGLALCRELVELHGGTITAASTPNAGSQFVLSLPLLQQPSATLLPAPASLPTEPAQQMVPDAAPGAATTHRPALLLVEDDLDVQTYLVGLLQPDYDVVGHTNGQDAWTYLQSQLPDLIVSDVMMPLMDGITFCRQVKSHLTTCHLPVLMLTARTTIPDQLEGLTTGADDYITKPFHPELLLVRLRNLLTNRQLLKDKLRKELILQPAEVTSNSMDEAFLRQIMTLVEDNIENPDFNAASLGQSLHMSRSTFYRKLQAITDLSPGDFIREVRLKRAAQLLTRQELTVAEVAYAVGYNDLKTFRQNFQQRFGVTPSVYGKNGHTIQ